MNTYSRLALVGFLPFVLVACGGGGGGSSSDATNDQQTPESGQADGGSGTSSGTATGITPDTALSVSQEATSSVNDSGSSGDALNDAFSKLGSIGSSSSAVTLAGVTTNSAQCPGGGSLTIDSQSSSPVPNKYEGETAITYIANKCSVGSGVVFDGELAITVSSTTSGSGAMDMTMTFETGSSGFSTSECTFRGGFMLRIRTQQVNLASGTEYTNSYEYGTTSAGFESVCPDGSTSLAPNTTVSNQFSYTLVGGQVQYSSNTVTANGQFSAEGETYQVSSTGLEYPSSGTTSSFGSAACPTGGQITVTDDEGDQVNIYFGDDAPAPYVVQVTGPEGFVREFESCNAFMSASE